MNTLEVTYADKAGRLIEQSPDKKAIEDLKTAVQELQGKTLKIYYVEDNTITPEDLADVDGLLDALAKGEYQAVYLKQTTEIYYVTNYKYTETDIDTYVQLVNININKLRSFTYYKGEDDHIWFIDDNGRETYAITLAEPGTKLYRHSIKLTSVQHGSISFTVYSTSSAPYEKSNFYGQHYPATQTFILGGGYVDGHDGQLIWVTDRSGPGYSFADLGLFYYSTGVYVTKFYNELTTEGNVLTDTVTPL